jgi:hypothetical protein
MRHEVAVSGLSVLLGEPMDLRHILERDSAIVTDEREDGKLVVVAANGTVIPPELCPGPITLTAREAPAEDVERIRAAGYQVRVLAWCAYCGDSLSEAEARSGTGVHDRCARDARETLATLPDPTDAYAAWLRKVLASSGAGADGDEDEHAGA